MVPFADMLNHRGFAKDAGPSDHEIIYYSDENNFHIDALVDLKQGNEIYSSYGFKTR